MGIEWESVERIRVVQDRRKWSIVRRSMKFQASKYAGIFLAK
jgi:hypothetical protein